MRRFPDVLRFELENLHWIIAIDYSWQVDSRGRASVVAKSSTCDPSRIRKWLAPDRYRGCLHAVLPHRLFGETGKAQCNRNGERKET